MCKSIWRLVKVGSSFFATRSHLQNLPFPQLSEVFFSDHFFALAEFGLLQDLGAASNGGAGASWKIDYASAASFASIPLYLDRTPDELGNSWQSPKCNWRNQESREPPSAKCQPLILMSASLEKALAQHTHQAMPPQQQSA